MAAVPPVLHGSGMNLEVFKCLEAWWASKDKDGHNVSIGDFGRLTVAYGLQMNDLKSIRASNMRLNSMIDSLKVESKLLKERNETLQENINEAELTEKKTRKEVLALEKDRKDFVERMAAMEKRTTTLSKQIDTFRVQAKALAAQAQQRRLEIVSVAFGKTSFVEEFFVPTRLVFDEPTQMMAKLPSELRQSLSIYFLPCPPRSMPLHIPKIAQAGYWFHPPIITPEGSPVELVVEAKSHEWLYLGQYLCAPFDGEDMKLSEWIELDPLTKNAYCAAVSRTLKEKHDQEVSCVDIQQQLDSGEYAPPCYSLQCVGYDLALQGALIKASASPCLKGTHPSVSEVSQSAKFYAPVSLAVESYHSRLSPPVPSATLDPKASAGQRHPAALLSTKKCCHPDDEVSATKKARVDGREVEGSQ